MSQVETANAAFSPSTADIDFARNVITAFRKAEIKALGAVAFGGQALDKPVVDRMRAVLESSRLS